jgi:DinB superfamily
MIQRDSERATGWARTAKRIYYVMPIHQALALESAIDREIAVLRQITEPESAFKPAPGGWSKKEELGHLIDSAANNHLRFVRATIEPEFRGLGYQQDEWVRLHGYQEMAWTDIVDFWRHYNDFLVGLVKRIPERKLLTPCVVGESAPVTLKFLIEDYVLHMQHHLDHILERETITAYPGAALGV